MGTKSEQEMRAKKRICAKLPVSAKSFNPLSFGTNGSMEGTVRDFDSDFQGIYLGLNNRVLEGSLLELILPVHAEAARSSEEWVRCTARVVRVEEFTEDERFGVAAVIEGYEFIEAGLAAEA